MQTEKTREAYKDIIEKEQRYAQLLGIPYWEFLSFGLDTKGKTSFHEVEERKAKAREIFGKHDSILEAEIKKYIIQGEKNTADNNHPTPAEKEKCLICGIKYHGAYSICGICGHVYREEFMKKR